MSQRGTRDPHPPGLACPQTLNSSLQRELRRVDGAAGGLSVLRAGLRGGLRPQPPPPALAAPRRRQREASSKTKKAIPGGGVPRKEGTAEGEVRGGEREGAREERGRRRSRLGNWANSAALPRVPAGQASRAPPSRGPGAQQSGPRFLSFWPASSLALSPGGGRRGHDRRSGSCGAPPSRPLAPGDTSRPPGVCSAARGSSPAAAASPPGLGHLPAFSVKQV